MVLIWVLLMGLFIYGIYQLYFAAYDKITKDSYAQTVNRQERIKSSYLEYLSKKSISIPENHISGDKLVIWCDEENNLFYCTSERGFYFELNSGYMYERTDDIKDEGFVSGNIHSDDILYFTKEGDISYTSRISGGGTNGPNLSGAIIGGLVAGSTGAIIGGQNQVRPITSTTESHDLRKTILFYKDGEKTCRIEMEKFDLYDYLLSKYPQKDYAYMLLSQTHSKDLSDDESTTDINNNESIVDRMKQLNVMLEEHLITEEEYDVKKKQLLDKL